MPETKNKRISFYLHIFKYSAVHLKCQKMTTKTRIAILKSHSLKKKEGITCFFSLKANIFLKIYNYICQKLWDFLITIHLKNNKNHKITKALKSNGRAYEKVT